MHWSLAQPSQKTIGATFAPSGFCLKEFLNLKSSFLKRFLQIFILNHSHIWVLYFLFHDSKLWLIWSFTSQCQICSILRYNTEHYVTQYNKRDIFFTCWDFLQYLTFNGAFGKTILKSLYFLLFSLYFEHLFCSLSHT